MSKARKKNGSEEEREREGDGWKASLENSIELIDTGEARTEVSREIERC